MHLQQILDMCEECSGQVIDGEKSSVMFSKNTMATTKQTAMNSLSLNSEAANEKLLGSPICFGRSKAKAFQYLRDRIWKSTLGWKEKMLSMAGEEVPTC